MRTILRRTLGSAFALTLLLVPAACSDEDGDGAETDEEVDEVDEELEDTGEQLDEELDEGEDEVEE